MSIYLSRDVVIHKYFWAFRIPSPREGFVQTAKPHLFIHMLISLWYLIFELLWRIFPPMSNIVISLEIRGPFKALSVSKCLFFSVKAIQYKRMYKLDCDCLLIAQIPKIHVNSTCQTFTIAFLDNLPSISRQLMASSFDLRLNSNGIF